MYKAMQQVAHTAAATKHYRTRNMIITDM